jgi:hypothetical protein
MNVPIFFLISIDITCLWLFPSPQGSRGGAANGRSTLRQRPFQSLDGKVSQGAPTRHGRIREIRVNIWGKSYGIYGYE